MANTFCMMSKVSSFQGSAFGCCRLSPWTPSLSRIHASGFTSLSRRSMVSHKTMHHTLREAIVTWMRYRIDKLPPARTDLLSVQTSVYKQLPSGQVSPQTRGLDYFTLLKTRHPDTLHHLRLVPCLLSVDPLVARHHVPLLQCGLFLGR